MIIDSQILAFFHDEAVHSVVDEIHFGLAYSAVTLTDGRIGLCRTSRDPRRECCTVFGDRTEYEKKRALYLLQQIQSGDPLARTLAIALANALNANFAAACPPDMGALARDLGLTEGDTLAMVGHFEPVERQMRQIGIKTICYDAGKDIGSEESFYDQAKATAKAAVLTATSLTNGTIERVAKRLGTTSIPTVLMGPSTVMRPELYGHLGLALLAGFAPSDKNALLKTIRNGRGTRDLLKYGRKVHLFLP